GHEHDVAQRHLPGHADEQAEAGEYEHEGGHGGGGEEPAAAQASGQHGGQQGQRHDEPGREAAGGHGARPPRALVGAGQFGELALRGEDQHGEQDDEGQARRQPGQRLVADHELGGQLGGDADGQGAGVGQRQADEAPDRRRPEGVEDEQREADGVEAEEGRQQDAREGGEGAADDPAGGGDATGVDPGQLGQRPVVDHRPGEGPEAGAEEQRQPDAGGGGDDDEDDLVPPDVDAGEAERRLGQERLDAPGGRAVEDEEQALGGDEQAERHHDVGRARRPFQAAQQQAVDDDADGRPDEEDGDAGRQPGRQPTVGPEAVEHERGRHADGAVGEVEHARRLVGDDEANGGNGV